MRKVSVQAKVEELLYGLEVRWHHEPTTNGMEVMRNFWMRLITLSATATWLEAASCRPALLLRGAAAL